jgi:hypothetical protein
VPKGGRRELSTPQKAPQNGSGSPKGDRPKMGRRELNWDNFLRPLFPRDLDDIAQPPKGTGGIKHRQPQQPQGRRELSSRKGVEFI